MMDSHSYRIIYTTLSGRYKDSTRKPPLNMKKYEHLQKYASSIIVLHSWTWGYVNRNNPETACLEGIEDCALVEYIYYRLWSTIMIDLQKVMNSYDTSKIRIWSSIDGGHWNIYIEIHEIPHLSTNIVRMAIYPIRF